MATMWGTMRKHHENQSKIATALRFLDASQSPKETSVHHHERTNQLCVFVQVWQTQFDKLITHQKEYIKALNSWLKLNLVPIDNQLKEKDLSPQRTQSPPIEALLHAWHGYLEELPNEVARDATKSLVGVMDSIMQYQSDEMKLRDRCVDTRKELARKTRQFEDWKSKYMQRRTPPDDMDPVRANDKDLIVEKQLAVETLQKRLEEDEEAYQKQCIQVRDKSLTTLKTRLPEVFRAMFEFSNACSDMYRNLRSISQPHKPNESS